MLRKLGKSNQVAIPKNILDSLGLSKDDYLEVYVEDDKIIMKPIVPVPKDQAYFYTKEWQIEERQADKDIAEDRVTKTKNMEELFRMMDEE